MNQNFRIYQSRALKVEIEKKLKAYTKSVPKKRTQGLTHHGVRVVVKL